MLTFVYWQHNTNSYMYSFTKYKINAEMSFFVSTSMHMKLFLYSSMRFQLILNFKLYHCRSAYSYKLIKKPFSSKNPYSLFPLAWFSPYKSSKDHWNNIQYISYIIRDLHRGYVYIFPFCFLFPWADIYTCNYRDIYWV